MNCVKEEGKERTRRKGSKRKRQKELWKRTKREGGRGNHKLRSKGKFIRRNEKCKDVNRREI